jgi:hypothetical protein
MAQTTTELMNLISRTVRDSADSPTIFVVVSGTVRGESRYFVRDVETQRTCASPGEMVVATVWRGSLTV